MSEPSSLSITELTGTKNELVFTGRALPYRPVSFEGTMRLNVSRSAGNPVGTSQILGAEEAPTTFNGMWKDRFMKAFSDSFVPVRQQGLVTLNGAALADVRNVVRVVDEMRMRGQLLSVRWDSIIRHGHLRRFKQTWHRAEDVEWEMDFEWISRGETITPIAFSFQVPSFDIANEIQSAIDGLVTLVKAPFALVQNIQREIDNNINALSEAAATLTATANNAVKTVLSPLDTARSALSALQTVQNSAASIERTFRSIPARALRAGREIASIAYDETLEAEDYARRARAQARALRYLAAMRRQELQANTVDQEVVQTFIATQGLDLRDVSTRFYGTPDEWRRIASFNGLTSSTLPGGAKVLVPVLTKPGV